jgi:phage terminase small subunit
MPTAQTRRAPVDLSETSKEWWRTCVKAFQFSDPDFALLEEACHALDRALEARALVAKDGAFIQGRLGLKAHPAILVERDSITLWSRLVRQLRLPIDPEPPQDALASALKAKNGHV